MVPLSPTSLRLISAAPPVVRLSAAQPATTAPKVVRASAASQAESGQRTLAKSGDKGKGKGKGDYDGTTCQSKKKEKGKPKPKPEDNCEEVKDKRPKRKGGRKRAVELPVLR